MTPRRVLVIYAGWLGDLVWIVPCLHALKTTFSSVSLVVSEVQAPLAEVMKHGLVDAVYVDAASRRLAAAQEVRQAARAKGIDTFLDLKGRLKTGLFMPWSSQATLWMPARCDAREYALARLLHPRARLLPPQTGVHRVDAFLSSLRELGLPETPVSFTLPFSAAIVAQGEAVIRREGLRGPRTVALHPGSAQFSKLWPAARFRRLAEILKQDLGCRVVIMGARDFGANTQYDLQVAHRHFGDGAFPCLVEETSLAVDAYLLSSGVFSVSVGNDSFANHMAGSASEVSAHVPGAVQAGNGRWYKANRTVSLFGPTNPVYCRPYDPTGAFNRVVVPGTYPPECVYDRVAHTCPHYGDSYCVTRAHCMEHLSVAQVVDAVEAALRQGDAGDR